MTAAFSKGWLQGWEGGCAARAAPGCPSEQDLYTPGAVCWGRDSAACQGQHSACPRSSPWHCKEKLWAEGVTLDRAGSFCCMGQGCSQLQITPTAFPSEVLKVQLPEGEGVCLLRFLILVCRMTTGTFSRGFFIWKVKGGMTVEMRSFPESAHSLSSSGDYRQQQHPLASFIRVCVSCTLVPAHMERLQGRGGHTGAGLGSVSTGREEMWGQRKTPGRDSSRQSRWAGREGTAHGNAVAGEIWAPPGHALQWRCLP